MAVLRNIHKAVFEKTNNAIRSGLSRLNRRSDEDLENSAEEQQILTDQDDTLEDDIAGFDESGVEKRKSLEAVEDDPEDFIEGEIDVKKQMDLATEAVADSFAGVQERTGEDDRNSELLETFRSTPGGLEEVILKTDQDLAAKKKKKKSKNRTSVIPIKIKSAVLKSIAYDSRRNILEIEFRSGHIYRYSDVPRSVYEALLAAPSKGRFFDSKIRERYKTKRVS